MNIRKRNELGNTTQSRGLRVLFVHQGAELYGSDRTFAQTVRGFRRAEPESHLTVILASSGPLIKLLEPNADEIIITPLLVLRKQLLKTGQLFNIPAMVRAISKAMAAVDDYDAVYINTAVILDFILACRFKGVPAVLHVHELPTGVLRLVMRMLVRSSRATLIFNSQATRKAFSLSDRGQHLVIPNGTLISAYSPLQLRDTLRILMIGRFNSWKGQGLLVSALARLEKGLLARIEVVMVGGVYKDQHHFKDDVIRQSEASRLDRCIRFLDFVEDPSELYHWSAVVVVPSLLPEPFGLVAIEAMGHGRPVIAADHGGLVDIVADGITGIRFHPGDPEALASALRVYLQQPELIVRHGAEGRKRYLESFHEDRYMTSVADVIRTAVKK